MAYPYLPVNPCCTDVVLNDPCGCSSVITNSGCNSNDPCSTNLTASSTIVYDGLALSCIIAEPCDTLNVILQKIDEIICNLLTQINTLTIQVNNITTQITNINGDIININNQLVDCCNATTTTTSTAAPIPCESFSLDNTGPDPVAIIITDCITGDQEAIVLLPGATDICVETDSPLTVPGTVIVTPNGPCGTTTTTTSSTSSTTTTSTTAFPCECLTFYNDSVNSQEITYIDCNGVNQYNIILPYSTNSYCGCCGEAPGSLDVTISIGGNCIDGLCPGEPTTTTTTTIESSCNCVDVIISQDDLDDATGNTLPFFDGKVNLFPAKDLTCEDENLDDYYSVAGTYTYCLKASVIPTIILQYVKDDEVITSVQSQIVNLETPCLVNGECIPTTTTTTTLEPTTTTTTTFEGTTTTTTTNGEPTTTTTTTVIPCDCLTFENTDIRPHNIGYTDCNDLPVTGINIDPSEIISFCGAHAVVSDPSVTVTVGEACVLGVCQTTTTTTTTIAPTTTTTTSFLGACTCFDITISQTDIDDATGNTGGYDGNVYLQTSKGSGCEGAPDIAGEYSVAGTYNFCITTSFINTIQLFYYKNDVAIFYPATASTFDILYSACSVTGDCEPTTTTTTTADISCTEVAIDAYTPCPDEEYATVEYTDCEGNVQTIQASPGDLPIVCMLNSSTPVYLCGTGGFQYGGACSTPTTTTTTTVEPTTTTTTTVEPTTTTTTTLSDCLEYSFDGGIDGGTFTYINCIVGPEQTYTASPGNTGVICVNQVTGTTGTVSVVLIGNCPPA